MFDYSLLVDYLTFSVKNIGYGNNWRLAIRNFLRMNPDLFTDCGYGGLGYNKSFAYSGIRVYCDGREELDNFGQVVYPMGICISMSGDGCRMFEDNCEKYQIIDLLEFLLPYVDNGKVNVTRLDIASDDKTGILDIGEIWSYVKAKKLNTRLKDKRHIEDIDKNIGGETVYIGDVTSDFRFRIYDKAAERGLTDGTHWIRVEMVCRGEYAVGAARQLVAHRDRLGECVAGMILERLKFIELNRTRRTNCTIAEWWADFLQTIEQIEFFFKEKPEHTAEKLKYWMLEQLAASFATAKEIFGAKFILYVLKEGRKKLSKKQRALINEHCPLAYPFVM